MLFDTFFLLYLTGQKFELVYIMLHFGAQVLVDQYEYLRLPAPQCYICLGSALDVGAGTFLDIHHCN